MSIRKVLVPLTGSDTDSTALTAAFRVAASQGAHVDGLYLRPDPAEAVPYVGDAASAAVIEDIYHATKTAADAASASARLALEGAARAAQAPLADQPSPAGLPSARFLDEMGSIGRVVVRHARLADLVVTAELTKNPPALAAFESVLMGARRPVLIAPPDRQMQWGSSVVIGWNGSTEASFAVQSALPLLKSARSITVLGGEIDSGEAAPPTKVVTYLGLHGISARAEMLDLKGKSPGAALLERASALGADLIVMGGYGHSRLREFILGGVTRHMITNATIAVLMAH